jgi:hypothetical protein
MEPEITLDSQLSLIETIINGFVQYIKIMISYLISIFFLLMGITLLFTKIDTIPFTSKIYFFVVVFALVCVSWIIHKDTVQNTSISKQLNGRVARRRILILLVNSVAFLFNFIYLVVSTGTHYGQVISFGGIETFIFQIQGKDGVNLIETAYRAIFAILYFSLFIMIIGYGLSLKDTFTKAGTSVLGVFAVIGSIICGFGLFLFVLFNQELCLSFTHFLAGSLIAVYATNLFKKNSAFLKL